MKPRQKTSETSVTPKSTNFFDRRIGDDPVWMQAWNDLQILRSRLIAGIPCSTGATGFTLWLDTAQQLLF